MVTQHAHDFCDDIVFTHADMSVWHHALGLDGSEMGTGVGHHTITALAAVFAVPCQASITDDGMI